MDEGSLLIMHSPLTTAAGAEAIGRVWLTEHPDRPTPLVVFYRDVEGKQDFVWVHERGDDQTP